MLHHYLAVAWLTFRKSPLVAIANVTVLALGLTAFVATYAATDFWDGAERQFANSQRTYIISSRIEMKDGSVALYETPATNPFIADHLPAYFPQLEAVSRAMLLGTHAVVSATDARRGSLPKHEQLTFKHPPGLPRSFQGIRRFSGVPPDYQR